MIAFVIPVVFWLLFSVTSKLYSDVDNYSIAIVLNGLLGNNNFSQHQHPLLCIMIKGLSIIMPSADCFTVMVHILLIAALGWVIHILWESFTGKTERVLICSFILYMVWTVNIWNVNYTVQAAFLCFAGFISLFLKQNRTVGIIFFSFGLMLRIQAALLFIPFFIVTVIAWILSGSQDINDKNYNDKKGDANSIKSRTVSELKMLAPFLVCFALLVGSRAVFFSVEPWRSGLVYEQTRQKVADFPMSEWNEIKDTAPELDRTVYEGIIRWMYADTDLTSIDNLNRMIRAGSVAEFMSRLSNIRTVLVSALLTTGYNLLEEFVPLVLLLIMTVLICIIDNNRIHRTASVLCLLGMLGIILYFIVRGRAIVRVWQSVMLACFSALISIRSMSRCEHDSSKTIKRLRSGLVAATVMTLVVCAIYSACTNMSFHHFVTAFDAQNVPQDPFDSFYDKDVRYLVCGWEEGASEEDDRFFVKNYISGWNKMVDMYKVGDKLPTSEFFRHFICSGHFWYGQEYYTSLLEEIGTPNPVKALIERDDVLLLDTSEDTLFREYFFVYMYDHYGRMSVKKVGNIMGYPVYEFRRTDDTE